MTDHTPQNPPLALRRYACPRCKISLHVIKARGCMSMHQHSRPHCNANGWGLLHKQTKEAR